MESCDTFVALGDVCAEKNAVVFGKNSDRPRGEVQEVVFVPGKQHRKEDAVQCTYIRIPEHCDGPVQDVVLSKPSWMWGAEMGANAAGVAIGNEAVWSRVSLNHPDDMLQPRLLGMDLLRLALERSSSAGEAVDVLTSLLETHGQGGQCSHLLPDMAYHNSFLVADAREAWVVETADRFWVAQRVTEGVRNISNCLSIGSDITSMHSGLKAHAERHGWWDGDGAFDWSAVLGNVGVGGTDANRLANAESRLGHGHRLLTDRAEKGQFNARDMMSVLRDEPSGICRPFDGGSPCPTAAAQVSVLRPTSDSSTHWFTATPDPSISVFKAVPAFSVLRVDGVLSEHTASAVAFPHKAKSPSDEAHALWRLHQQARLVPGLGTHAAALEREAASAGLAFHEAVTREMDVYRKLAAA